MKILIVYKSQHGATKQYAEWIHEELPDSELFSIDEFVIGNIEKYDVIIAGSCVYGGQMPALEFLINNWNILKDKKVFYFTVGVIPPDSSYSKEMYETIPTHIRDHIQYVKLPGQVSNSKPNFIEKWAFKTFIKGDINAKIDKEKIKPILEFVNSGNN